MKKGILFTLVALVIASTAFFANKAHATEYIIYGELLYGGSASSENVAYEMIMVYRNTSGTFVYHGQTETDGCGNFTYYPGEWGQYKLVFLAGTGDVVDTSNSCDPTGYSSSETQTLTTQVLTVFSPVCNEDVITD